MTAVWLLTLWLAGMVSATAAETGVGEPAKPRVLTLGVFAFRPKPLVADQFEPLAERLSSQLPGYTVVVRPLLEQELEAAMQAHEIDFVLTNPSHYIELREHHRLTGALATIVARHGEHGVHGIGGVVVRKAERTELQQLTDVQGKRVAIAGKRYLGTYMAPAAALLHAGVDLESITWVETSQPLDQVITSVLEGRADFGFVRTGVLENLEREGQLPPGALVALNPMTHPGFEFRSSTPLYPEWPFLAAADMDPAISQQVSAALMRLRPDDPAALAAGLYGFTIPADYARVEQAMRELHMAPFDQAPAFPWKDIWQRYHLRILGLGTTGLVTLLLALGLIANRRKLLSARTRLEAQHHTLSTATERLNYLMDSSPVMFYTLKVNRERTEPTWVSNNIERLLGYTASQARHMSWWRSHLHPDDAPQAIEALRNLHHSGHVRHQFRFAHADGTYHWFHNELKLLNTASAHVEALGIWRDISSTKQQEDSLQLAASVFKNSYDGIIITDASHRVVDTNPAFSRITGHARDRVLGRTLADLAMPAHGLDDPQGKLLHHMSSVLATQGHWQGELVLQRLNTLPLICAMSASVVRDSSQHTRHHVVVFSDIGHIKAHQAELDHLAHYDPLTGVPNRRMLVDRLAQAIERAKRSGHALAVCYLDLDDFKPVNDRLGHAVGDQLLIAMTRRLEGSLRAQDTLARLGGDEFVLLLADLTHPDEWQPVLQRVLHAVQQAVPLGEHHATVSASVGVTVYPTDDVDADTLLRHADQAMYTAKQAGRNRHHVFDPTQGKEVAVQRELHSRLRQALAHDELVLHYQPKVHMQTGQVVGAEALIRWNHPVLGWLPPGEFLWQIAGTDLEIAVGEWVIGTALKQLQTWKNLPGGLPTGFCVSVNLTGAQLLKPGFQTWLAGTLKQHNHWRAGELELEILESAALADMGTAAHVMTECRALGVRFALDDFGTGYSSLAYFRTLPVDVIKIDQSFVRDMLVDVEDHGIVQSVVQLAQAFRRPVIAEGVETLAHAAALLRLGCPLAQGYGIARPMPAEQLPQWIGDWSQHESWLVLKSHDEDYFL